MADALKCPEGPLGKVLLTHERVSGRQPCLQFRKGSPLAYHALPRPRGGMGRNATPLPPAPRRVPAVPRWHR